MSAADYAWMDSALCAQADPELWTQPGAGTVPKQICRRCPVLNACAQHAARLETTDGAMTGIWGGQSRRQRRTTPTTGEAA